jgi:protein PhnA
MCRFAEAGVGSAGYADRMNENPPPCPKCSCEYTYEMNALVVCPECSHEWVPAESGDTPGERVVKDSVGNVLRDGDSVVVVKALKVKGSPSGIKAGTKVRGIRLVDGVDGHDIDCKIDGFGAMQLKSGVVKKA